MIRTWSRRAVLVGAIVVATAACGDDGPVAEAEDPPVARRELADAAPPNAPGQHLYLQEVVISPGVRLPTHFHDGLQLGSIRSGVLTYHMVEGEVTVVRADGTSEVLAAPEVTELHPGDAVSEPADAIHFAENLGDEPVVITVAALVDQDADVSTVVD